MGIRRTCQLTGRLIIWVSLASITTAHAEDKNIVPNPGFEEENETKKGTPRAWTTDWTLFNTNTFWTREKAHSGKYSLKLAQTNEARALVWYNSIIPVKGDTVYTLSFWAKCPETSGYSASMQLYVFDKDKKHAPHLERGEPLGNWRLAFEQEGPFDWHKFSRQHKMPQEACYVQISLLFWMSAGRVYYDDVCLVAEEQVAEEKGSRNVLKRWINIIRGEQ